PVGVPLVDLLDRVLATGVVVSGDLVLAIADVPIECELRKRNSNSGASAGMEFRKRNSDGVSIRASAN
ncbi:gas vesicle protein, partial [Streptomyces sp. NPDC048324]|uniref:gas vesicle protein n=1 Tax=Streptomyces sp. NPDC048324 TaxID=3157205 RepID=UPI00341F3A68